MLSQQVSIRSDWGSMGTKNFITLRSLSKNLPSREKVSTSASKCHIRVLSWLGWFFGNFNNFTFQNEKLKYLKRFYWKFFSGSTPSSTSIVENIDKKSGSELYERLIFVFCLFPELISWKMSARKITSVASEVETLNSLRSNLRKTELKDVCHLS